VLWAKGNTGEKVSLTRLLVGSFLGDQDVAYGFSVGLTHFLSEHWRKIRASRGLGLNDIFGRFREVFDVVEKR
jgi:hypothetical protein